MPYPPLSTPRGSYLESCTSCPDCPGCLPAAERQPVQAGETAALRRVPLRWQPTLLKKNGVMGPNCHCPVFVIYILHYIYLKLLLSKPNGKNYLAVKFDSPPLRVLLILGTEYQNFTHWHVFVVVAHIYIARMSKNCHKILTLLNFVQRSLLPFSPHMGNLMTSSVVAASLARSFLPLRSLTRP